MALSLPQILVAISIAASAVLPQDHSVKPLNPEVWLLDLGTQEKPFRVIFCEAFIRGMHVILELDNNNLLRTTRLPGDGMQVPLQFECSDFTTIRVDAFPNFANTQHVAHALSPFHSREREVPFRRVTWNTLKNRYYQDPIEPVPYETREVKIPTTEPSVTLGGSLLIPRNGRNKKLVIFLGGSSGTSPRFDSVPRGMRSAAKVREAATGARVIADRLCRQGFSVLSCDSRGVDDSKGVVASASVDELEQDVLQMIRWYQREIKVESAPVAIVGHSGGGIVASLAAAKCKDIKGIVGLGTPLLPTRLCRIEQVRDSLEHAAAREISFTQAEEIVKLMEAFHGKDSSSPACQSAAAKARELALKLGLAEHQWTPLHDRFALGTKQMWSFHFSTPNETIQSLDIPCMFLFGANDHTVSYAQHLEWQKRQPISPNPRVTRVLLSGLDHNFSRVAERGKILAIDEGALETILCFINNQVFPAARMSK